MGSGKGKNRRVNAKGRTAWDRHQEKMAQKEAENVDLYSVFVEGTDKQVYPGKGVSLEQAERLSAGLLSKTEVRLIQAAKTSE